VSLEVVSDRRVVAPQRREVVCHRAAGIAAVVAAAESRRQGQVRGARLFPEPGLLCPIRFRAGAHRDPDLDPDLAGVAARPPRSGGAAGRRCRARSGQADRIKIVRPLVLCFLALCREIVRRSR
jgi:hypothetical protein